MTVIFWLPWRGGGDFSKVMQESTVLSKKCTKLHPQKPLGSVKKGELPKKLPAEIHDLPATF